MKKEENKRKIGRKYEDLAVSYLKEHGYKILERNFYAARYGEIDIVAEDEEGTLVICECKFRSTNFFGDPLEAVDGTKQKQICRSTLYYYRKQRFEMEHPCRFDVIAVYGDGTIKHIENAFEFHG